ncbi:MAG: TetR/AcrR family transcriptional regulator [Rhodococcus sp.]|nr:TetR/AcrR family transcriptional regulator [Rhodococcus sp. (in: high G+C Gram-positive bacteria)]
MEDHNPSHTDSSETASADLAETQDASGTEASETETSGTEDAPGAKGKSGPKPDGRKRRWRDHKIARRAELVDSTISAIRARGRDIGMDEIASEIGVSKTVLYRYFNDKNDLINATMVRYVETILAPRIYTAISGSLDEFELTKATVAAYVETVASDPEIYLYVMANNGHGSLDVVASSERMIAEVLGAVLTEKLSELDMEVGGAVPWSYGIVGSVQLATHWWISNQSISKEEMIGYLTMMTWGGITGIASVKGSREIFDSRPHSLELDS